MNTKTYCVLLSTLLAGTFILEIEIKAKSVIHPYEVKNVQKRDAEDSSDLPSVFDQDQCRWVCDAPVTQSNVFVVKQISGLYGYLNPGSVQGVIFDRENQLVAITNGRTGDFVVFSHSSNSVVYLQSSVVSDVWLYSHSSFEAYVFRQTCLSGLYENQLGVRYPIDAIDDDSIHEVIYEAVVSIYGFQSGVNLDNSTSLSLVNSLAFSFFNIIGNIDGYQFKNNYVLSVYGGVSWLLNVFNTYSSFVQYAGSSYYYFRNVELSNIFSEYNGIENFNYIVRQTGTVLDLGYSYDSLLNNPSDFLFVLSGLGGYSHGGVSGVLKFTGYLNNYLSGHADYGLERVLGQLVLLVSQKHVGLDTFYDDFYALLDLLQANPEYQTSLSSLFEFGTAFKAGNYVKKGVNVSNIIQILISGLLEGTEPLDLIVTVLLNMQSLCSLSSSVSSLFFVLFVNSNYGYADHILGPLGISVPDDLGSGSNLLLINSIDAEFSSQFSFLEPYEAYCESPILASIVTAVENVVQQYTTISLYRLLSRKSTAVTYIAGYFQQISRYSFRVSEKVQTSAYSIAQSISGYEVYSGGYYLDPEALGTPEPFHDLGREEYPPWVTAGPEN